MLMMKFIKSFFMSRGNFQPVYFWATVCLSLFVTSCIIKFLGYDYLSDQFVLGLAGFISVWIGLYNAFKKGGGDDKTKL